MTSVPYIKNVYISNANAFLSADEIVLRGKLTRKIITFRHMLLTKYQVIPRETLEAFLIQETINNIYYDFPISTTNWKI